MSEIKEWPMLYVKTATGSINFWHIHTDGSSVIVKWGQLGTTSPQTDGYVAKAKNVSRKNETSPTAQAQKEAQAKFDKQIRLKYVYTIHEAEQNINIKPMRCYKLDEKRAKKIVWPVTVQPKFNGVRCMAYNSPSHPNGIRLMSRGGKDYTLPHIQETLQGRIPAGMCLDGELYVHGASLQHQRHLIETYTQDSLAVGYTLYDYTALPPNEAQWFEREHALANWFTNNSGVPYMFFAQSIRAQAMYEVDHLHDEWVKLGYEGAIIRLRDGIYKLHARSRDVLKYKKFKDAEFKVVGFTVGKDGVIIYRCKQEEGKLFDVRPEGNEAERATLLKEAEAAVGQPLTVRYQERSDDNIPIFPVGVAFRPQKDMS